MKPMRSHSFSHAVLAVTVVLLVLLTSGSGAMQAQSENTAFKEITLENGLRVIHEHDDSSQITVVQFFIKGGQRAEPAGKAGLAYQSPCRN